MEEETVSEESLSLKKKRRKNQTLAKEIGEIFQQLIKHILYRTTFRIYILNVFYRLFE